MGGENEVREQKREMLEWRQEVREKNFFRHAKETLITCNLNMQKHDY